MRRVVIRKRFRRALAPPLLPRLLRLRLQSRSLYAD
ncbi:hypothetical protein ANCCAN_18349 [Ancylostoma caninum]|uniref:Uncharacterized protein n=1 Tax=Ancylostoma caninum TaxID=29170 RepID=A0A368FYC2_ANCCA|nr:hypothetical protein ANCCAN_18349 [Ancylostoma caninum]